MGVVSALLFISLSLVGKAQEILPGVRNELRPFTTDGCSRSKDGNWKHCCVAHDMSYWMGGSWEDKKLADQELRACMIKAGAGETLAQHYYIVVRVAGSFLKKTKYRWGNGWRYVRPMTPLSPEEQSEVEIRKPSLREAMNMKLDGDPGAPSYLPSITGDHCMDQMIYFASKFAEARGVHQVTVDRLAEHMVLGGGTKYEVGLKECPKSFKVSLKLGPQECQKKVYSPISSSKIFNLNSLEKQLKSCFK